MRGSLICLMSSVIFAFEDVSDRLATRRAYNALLQVQEEILNNLFDAVIIFGSNGRLKAYNQAYLSLWNLEELFLEGFETEKVETMAFMFSECNKLTSLDLSKFLEYIYLSRICTTS